MTNNSTIAAISTPAGVGGIAVARVSGPQAIDIVNTIWRGPDLKTAKGYSAHYGTIYDPSAGRDLDQAIATIFRSPKSFTGEDVVEISVHGSRWIQRELINLLISAGATAASAGEFTQRAFLNGKLDLTEAEAVADMIASSSRASHKVALSQMKGDFSRRLSELRSQLIDIAALLELELDFSEEEVEFASRQRLIELAQETDRNVITLASSFRHGAAIKEGIPVAIIGETNAGKSSLLNKLVRDERAIVSDIHGTTRDTINEKIDIEGIMFSLTDTAGIRQTNDPIENAGIERTIKAANSSSILLWVIDSTDLSQLNKRAADETAKIKLDNGENTAVMAVINKKDTPGSEYGEISKRLKALDFVDETIVISALTGEGIEQLRETILKHSGLHDLLTNDDIIVTNHRHYEALERTHASLQRVIKGLQNGEFTDFIAQDLREALHYLGEITGAITTPDLLATIFSRFCIGK